MRGDYGKRDDYFDRFVPGEGTSDICSMLRRIPGYDATKTQVLSHDAEGNCSWVDVTECE